MKRVRLIRHRTAANARRKSLAAPRRAWSPIGLVWPNRARNGPVKVGRPTGPISRNRSFLNFQLHFNFLIRGSARTVIAPVARMAAPIRWRQRDVHHASLLKVVQALPMLTVRSFAERKGRTLVTAQRTDSVVRTRMSPRIRRSNAGHSPSFSRADIHVRSTTSALRLSPFGVAAAPPPSAALQQRRLWRRLEGIQLLLRKPVASAVPKSVVNEAQRSWQMPELVWPVASEARTAETIERLVGEAVPAFSVGAAAASLEQSIATPPSLRPQTIDPALIDRVAEDVMGRMERRIRIERERRGM